MSYILRYLRMRRLLFTACILFHGNSGEMWLLKCFTELGCVTRSGKRVMNGVFCARFKATSNWQRSAFSRVLFNVVFIFLLLNTTTWRLSQRWTVNAFTYRQWRNESSSSQQCRSRIQVSPTSSKQFNLLSGVYTFWIELEVACNHLLTREYARSFQSVFVDSRCTVVKSLFAVCEHFVVNTQWQWHRNKVCKACSARGPFAVEGEGADEPCVGKRAPFWNHCTPARSNLAMPLHGDSFVLDSGRKKHSMKKLRTVRMHIH